MNVGIIGYGSIGERHLKNILKYHSNFNVKVLTKRKDLKNYGKVVFLSSERDFFSNQFDIFFVTNETHKHASTVLKCIKNLPKAIFVEKPISHSFKNVENIKRQIEEHKISFFIGYCLQFNSAIIKLKNIVRKKEVGDVLYIRISVGQDIRTWRDRDYKESYSYDSKKGGGVVLDLIHEINYPAWILDESIDFVSGSVFKSGHFDMKAEDISDSVFKTSKGKIVSVHQDCLQSVSRRYCEIVGTKGIAIWDSFNDGVKIIKKGHLPKTVKITSNDIYKDEQSFFIKKVKGGEYFNNIDEGIHDLKNVILLKKYGKR